MKTLTADAHQRVRIPTAKPRQVFAFTTDHGGVITLTPLKQPKRKEPFPPGSLDKYFTAERDREEALIFSGCVKGPE